MLSNKVRKISRRWMISLVIAIFGMSSIVPLWPQVSAQAAATPEVPLLFSPPEDIGPMVTSPSTADAAFGVEDGKQVMYTTVTGDPAIFSVVDLEDYSLIRTVPLPGGGQSNGHAIDSKGRVYIISKDGLYRYSPETKDAVRLTVVEGAGTLYGLAIDENDNLYGGTYPTGRIFKYDTNAEKLTIFDRLSESRDYVRSVAYYDGKLYAGTGSVGELYRVNLADGSKERIPFPDSPMYEDLESVPQLYTMSIVRHYMFILTSGHHLLIYDLLQEEWLPEWTASDQERYYRGMTVSPELDGKVYVGMEGQFQTFDLETRQFAETGVEFTPYIRGSAWVEMNDPDLPGKSLITVLFNGGIAAANFTSRTVKTFAPVVPGTPVSIQSLEFGPDGLLYSSGYQGTYAARYNIENGEKELFNMGQAEGMIPFGDKMIFGEYSGAFMHELDPAQPLELGVNPKTIYQIPDEQDRPFALATGDNKLFVGTIPKQGKLGGALSIYDGSSWESYRNIVANQSIIGLAYREGEQEGEGLLYGSTTVWGGLDSGQLETAAKMFVWDVKEKKVIHEFIPDIDQAAGVQAKAIGGLSFGPDGLLWGAAYGTLFAMNPDTYEIVKQKEIHPTNWDFSHVWVPTKLRWGNDGFLYTTLGSKITVVDPETMAHVTIPGTKTNLMVVGPDGNIYYNEAAILKKIEVTAGDPPEYVDVEIPLMNSGFEQVNADGTIPGWENFGPDASRHKYEVSSEQAAEGSNSLKVTDDANDVEVGVISLPFAVEPGYEHTVKLNMYLQSGRTIAAMKYYDASGEEIRLSPAPAVYYTGPAGSWKPAEFSSIAPEGAATGKVVLFCSLGWIGAAYYDQVQVFKKMPFETPGDAQVVQMLPVANPGFEQRGQSGAIPGWTLVNSSGYSDSKRAVLSQEKVKDGEYALHIFDNDTNFEVKVDSELIPVWGDRTYTTSVDLYRGDYPENRSSNRPFLLVRYFDQDKKELSTSLAPGPWSVEDTGALNRWTTLSLTNKAPAATKYIRISVNSPKVYVANAYFDNIGLSTVLQPGEAASLRLSKVPLSQVVAGTDVSFQVMATSGSKVVVEENGTVLAEADGAGDDVPVTVTIPQPAAGAHTYRVYATLGLSRTAPIDLPVTIHALSDLVLPAEEFVAQVGETKTVHAKAVYGPIAFDIIPDVTTGEGAEGLVSVQGALITGTNEGSGIMNVSYGGIAKEMPITVKNLVLDSLRLELPKNEIAVNEQLDVRVVGVYKNAFTQQEEERQLSEGVTLTAQPEHMVSIDNRTVTGAAVGTTVLQAVYGSVSATAHLQVVSAGGNSNPYPGNNPGGQTGEEPGTEEGSRIVGLDELVPVDGTVKLELGEDVSKLLLPIQATELAEGTTLEIVKGGATIELSDAFLASIAKLYGDGEETGQIGFEFRLLSGIDRLETIGNAKPGVNGVKLGSADGELIQLGLSLLSASGESKPIHTLEEPVKLSFAIDESRDASLLGIYYIADDGTLEYVGGKREGKTFHAELFHFSTYGLLEYDRSYADVPPSYWASETIRVLSAKHVIQGVNDSEFKPSATMTRAEFVAILVRAFGFDQPAAASGANSSFADVAQDDWFYDAVSAGVNAGIVSGVSPDRFNPNGAITREQMVVLIVRAWEASYGELAVGQAGLSAFKDASDASIWAEQSLQIAVERSWIQGQGGDVLAPADYATRAESAKLLFNVLQHLYK